MGLSFKNLGGATLVGWLYSEVLQKLSAAAVGAGWKLRKGLYIGKGSKVAVLFPEVDINASPLFGDISLYLGCTVLPY